MINKIKNFYYIGIVIVTLISLISCVKDTTNTTYNGPDLVEFANPNYIAPLNPIAKTVSTTSIVVGSPRADSMFIQLVGPQRSTDTKVNFEIDALSTAVAGTDYTLTTPSPAIILANTSGVKVRVTINKVTAQKRIIFNITSGDNVTPSANFKTFTFTLNP
jgi:hypothetical protein